MFSSTIRTSRRLPTTIRRLAKARRVRSHRTLATLSGRPPLYPNSVNTNRNARDAPTEIQRSIGTSTHVRAFASSSAHDNVIDGVWERLQRRDGSHVYYNRQTRETTASLPPGVTDPGRHSTQHEASADAKASHEQDASTSISKAQSKEDGVESAKRDHEITEVEDPENALLVPIDFDKAASIDGNDAQVLHVTLEPNQKLRADTGSMLYMTEGVEINTVAAGGLSQGFKRLMTGQSFFVSDFTFSKPVAPEETAHLVPESGNVAFSSSFPSKIKRMNLKEYANSSIICQKGAFLCGSSTIDIEMEFTKRFSAGFFGGEGFVLQRLSGDGDAFVRGHGSIIEKDLEPNEVLRISSGSLVCMESSVHYDVQMMPGFKNVVFGGEGLFLTTLTGPGRVYLESNPMDRVVDQVARRVPSGGGGPGIILPMGMGGGGEGGAATGQDAASGAASGAAASAMASGDAAGLGTNDDANTDQDIGWASPSNDDTSSTSPGSGNADDSGTSEFVPDEPASEDIGFTPDNTTSNDFEDSMSNGGDNGEDFDFGDDDDGEGGVASTAFGFFSDLFGDRD